MAPRGTSALLGHMGKLLLIFAHIYAVYVRAVCPPGMVAIMSVNGDLPDAFSFVALQPLNQYIKLFFTDNGWTGTALNTNEATVAFNASIAIASGTVVTFDGTFPGTDANGVWEKISALDYDFATNNDQLLGYCGDSLAPEFFYGYSTNAWTTGANPSTSQSVLPAGLLEANASVILLSFQNAYYDGVKSGLASDLLGEIAKSANWKGDNTATTPTTYPPFVVLTPSPSANPTAAPSMSPTASPSDAPTAAPTSVPTGISATWLLFETYILIEEVDDAEAADPASITVLVNAMADVLPYVQKTYITVMSFLPARANRRYLKSLLSHGVSATQNYQAGYSIRVLLEELGYTSNQASLAYDRMKSDIDTAIKNGEFNLFLDKHAAENGVLVNASAPVTQSVSFSDYATADFALRGDSANKFIQSGVIAFTVIIVLIGAAFGGIFVYYYRRRDVSFKRYIKRNAEGKVPSPHMVPVKVVHPKAGRDSELSIDEKIVKNPMADEL